MPRTDETGIDEQIRSLIAANEIAKALELFTELSPDDAAAQSGRLNDADRSFNLGTIGLEEYNQIRNKIRIGILELTKKTGDPEGEWEKLIQNPNSRNIETFERKYSGTYKKDALNVLKYLVRDENRMLRSTELEKKVRYCEDLIIEAKKHKTFTIKILERFEPIYQELSDKSFWQNSLNNAFTGFRKYLEKNPSGKYRRYALNLAKNIDYFRIELIYKSDEFVSVSKSIFPEIHIPAFEISTRLVSNLSIRRYFQTLNGFEYSFEPEDDLHPFANARLFVAAQFANYRSAANKLDNVYEIIENRVTEDLTKNGFRLPKEAEIGFSNDNQILLDGNENNELTYSLEYGEQPLCFRLARTIQT